MTGPAILGFPGDDEQEGALGECGCFISSLRKDLPGS